MFGLFQNKFPPNSFSERIRRVKVDTLSNGTWQKKFRLWPTKTIYGKWIICTHINYFWFSFYSNDPLGTELYEFYYATNAELAQLKLGNTDIIMK